MNKESFKQFLKDAHEYCMPRLIRVTSSKVDAEDAFMEAIYQFWLDIQNNKIKHKGNLKALIFVSARNKWFNKNRKEKGGKTKMYNFSPETIESHVNNDNNTINHEESFDLLIKEENEIESNLKNEQRIEAMNQALKELSPKCQTLLIQSIVYRKKLKDLQQSLGFVSMPAIKMAKSRCRKTFIQKFELILNSLKN